MREAALTNNPKKEMKEIKLMIFLDFFAKRYLLAIKVDTFIGAKLMIPQSLN
tara:strand:- start:1196 stop:1351 length:156 start_codon:yes stop_codon:yes gene_type:complete